MEYKHIRIIDEAKNIAVISSKKDNWFIGTVFCGYFNKVIVRELTAGEKREIETIKQQQNEGVSVDK